MPRFRGTKELGPSPHLTDRGVTRRSTSIPWGGMSDEEFSNRIHQERARQMIDGDNARAQHEQTEAGRADRYWHHRAVRANNRYDPRRRED